GGAAHARKAIFDGKAAPGEPLREVFSFEELHGDERLPRRRLTVLDVANDTGMRKLGEDARLAAESLDRSLRRDAQHLHGDCAAADAIGGPKHRPHAAAPDGALDDKAFTDDVADQHELPS